MRQSSPQCSERPAGPGANTGSLELSRLSHVGGRNQLCELLPPPVGAHLRGQVQSQNGAWCHTEPLGPLGSMIPVASWQ